MPHSIRARTNSFAQPKKQYINYFEVADNIAQPVRIHTNLGDYSFSRSFTLHGELTRVEAFDAHGNKINNVKPQRRSIKADASRPNEYWYAFKDVTIVEAKPMPGRPPVNNYYNNYYGYGYYDPLDELRYDAGVTGIAAIAAVFVAGAVSTWDEKKNRFDLDVGYWSRCDGFGIGVAYRSPSIFGIAGGIGLAMKDHNLFRTSTAGSDYAYRSDSKRWYAAGQVWITNGWNLEVGVGNRYFDHLNDISTAISFSSNAEIHISGPVAFYGGLGCVTAKGGGDVFFIWNAGLRFRLKSW